MNIFYVAKNPQLAAQMLCDQHIVKMPTESTQMLCTVYRQYVPHFIIADTQLYKPTHETAALTKWVGANAKHYAWLSIHTAELFREYTRRFHKLHAAEAVFERVRDIPGMLRELDTFFEPPQVMPEHYRIPGNAVQAYRNYYIGDKLRMARYWRSEPPYWCAEQYERLKNG